MRSSARDSVSTSPAAWQLSAWLVSAGIWDGGQKSHLHTHACTRRPCTCCHTKSWKLKPPSYKKKPVIKRERRTPTHIKTHKHPHSNTWRVSHIAARGAGFTLPACSEPFQKLILQRCDSKRLASHLHWWWGGEGRREGGQEGEKREGGGGSSGRMTSPSLKCHHYLKPGLNCLQRWHHPLFAPPPSVLECVCAAREGCCLCASVCRRAFSVFKGSMSGCLSALPLSCL